jgi:WD40 repeat protein
MKSLLSLFLVSILTSMSVRAQRADLRVQLGPSDLVDNIIFSPDGKLVAIGSLTGAVLITDAASGREIRSWTAHTDSINAMAFSRDNRWLLTASGDGTAKMWDVRTGGEVHRFEGHSAAVSGVAFSPDDRRVITGSFDDSVRIWGAETGRELRRLRGQKGEFWVFVLSPDGRWLAAAGPGNVAGLWDMANGKKIQLLAGHSDLVIAVAFSPDGRYLLTGSNDRTARLWDLKSGREVRRFGDNSGPVNPVAFSPDGRFILTGDTEKVRIWEIHNGSEVSHFKGIGVCFSPDGQFVLMQSGDLLDRQSGVAVRHFGQHLAKVNALALSPDGQTLVIGSDDKALRVWNLTRGSESKRIQGDNGKLNSIAFSRDGRAVATGSADKVARLWDLESGNEIRRFEGHSGEVWSVAISPEGNRLLTGSGDKTARLWDLKSGDEIREFKGSASEIFSAVFSPDGKQVLTADDAGEETSKSYQAQMLPHMRPKWMPIDLKGLDQSPSRPPLISLQHSEATAARLWDAESGREIAHFDVVSPAGQYSNQTMSIAYSPDGQSIATGSRGRTARIWDVMSRRELKAYEALGPFPAVFSYDGKQLLTGSYYGTPELWDLAGNREARGLYGHSGEVHAAAFSPDGRHVLTGGLDGTSRVWDSTTGTLLATMVSYGQGAWVVVTPDGRFDASDLGGNAPLHWIADDDPMRPLPLEIFMRQYYTPHLLPQVLSGKKLPSLPSIALLNRVQPQVKIVSVQPDPAHDRKLKIVVAVQSQTSGKQSSGAKDLRLFRDAQLVGFLEGELNDGEYVFDNVSLPHGRPEEEVEITAYAFNRDLVKSQTSRQVSYKLPLEPNSVSRRAYVITFGVNANESHWNLELAVSSAEHARVLLRNKLKSEYEVIEIPLYADLAVDSPEVISTKARKGNLAAVLEILAGRADKVSTAVRGEIDPEQKLRAATPDDAVVLYVASHGYADPQGKFYVMPYDTGSSWGLTEDVLNRCTSRPDDSTICQTTNAFLKQSISSQELVSWWQGVDAGELLMILDSCHAGAVSGKEFRPGPLGDRGFGQLSYDKGMRILAAAQPTQTAMGDWIGGGEGQTLLVEGLEAAARANQTQSLSGWLQTAAQQLPVDIKRRYPDLQQEDIQLPEFMDFTKSPNVSTRMQPSNIIGVPN